MPPGAEGVPRGRRRAAAALKGYLRTYPFAPRYARHERDRVWTADGVRLSVARLQGPPGSPVTVVLLHGFLNSSRSPRIHAFARLLARGAHVIVPDMRGHGASGGHSTLGVREPLDVAAAVGAAPAGVPVVTVGVSLGGVAAVLHAATHDGVSGVVAVSAPGWFSTDGRGARRVARLLEARWGRAVAARLLRTRVGFGDGHRTLNGEGAAAAVAPAFLVVVHDPDDHFFDGRHAERLFAAARPPKDLWWYPGAGHGVDLLTPELAGRLLAELRARVGAAPRPAPAPDAVPARRRRGPWPSGSPRPAPRAGSGRRAP